MSHFPVCVSYLSSDGGVFFNSLYIDDRVYNRVLKYCKMSKESIAKCLNPITVKPVSIERLEIAFAQRPIKLYQYLMTFVQISVLQM